MIRNSNRVATFWKTVKIGKSQGEIREISVKVREFLLERRKVLDEVENPDASCVSSDAPYIRKENKKKYKSENLLVVEIFSSPTEPHT